MNIVAYGQKFFLFGGAILLAVAAVQWYSRPRNEDGSRPRPGFDATTMKTVLFVAVGILAILMGAGIVPMAGGQ